MSDTMQAEPVVLDLEIKEFNLGTLVTNAEAIREAVKVKLAGYKAENYSGDRLQDAKRDKAELNAAAKRLNDARLEYERKWMKPFEAFKAVVNETVGLIKTASAAIDEVVKDVEQGEKDEKRCCIEEYWRGIKCDLFALDQIFDARWLNKTYKLADVQGEIDERVKKVRADLVILDRLNEPEAKAHYLETLDLNAALDRADTLKRNRERIAAEEQARAEAEAKRKADDEVRAKAAEEAREADHANTIAIVDEILEEEGLADPPPEPAPEPLIEVDAPGEAPHLPWREALDIANAEIATLRAQLAEEQGKYGRAWAGWEDAKLLLAHAQERADAAEAQLTEERAKHEGWNDSDEELYQWAKSENRRAHPAPDATALREAAEIGRDYVAAALAEHDERYKHHPATEPERETIAADLAVIDSALLRSEKGEKE